MATTPLFSIYRQIEYSECPFKILGTTKWAKLSEVRDKYMALALRIHPDKAPTEDLIEFHTSLFQKVQAAYDEISDGPSRKFDDAEEDEDHEVAPVTSIPATTLHARNVAFREALRSERKGAHSVIYPNEAKQAKMLDKSRAQTVLLEIMQRSMINGGEKLRFNDLRRERLVCIKTHNTELLGVVDEALAEMQSNPPFSREEQRQFKALTTNECHAYAAAAKGLFTKLIQSSTDQDPATAQTSVAKLIQSSISGDHAALQNAITDLIQSSTDASYTTDQSPSDSGELALSRKSQITSTDVAKSSDSVEDWLEPAGRDQEEAATERTDKMQKAARKAKKKQVRVLAGPAWIKSAKAKRSGNPKKSKNTGECKWWRPTVGPPTSQSAKSKKPGQSKKHGPKNSGKDMFWRTTILDRPACSPELIRFREAKNLTRYGITGSVSLIEKKKRENNAAARTLKHCLSLLKELDEVSRNHYPDMTTTDWLDLKDEMFTRAFVEPEQAAEAMTDLALALMDKDVKEQYYLDEDAAKRLQEFSLYQLLPEREINLLEYDV